MPIVLLVIEMGSHLYRTGRPSLHMSMLLLQQAGVRKALDDREEPNAHQPSGNECLCLGAKADEHVCSAWQMTSC